MMMIMTGNNMAQKDKELLLRDLCARSPYGVKVSLESDKRKLTGVLDAVYPTDDRVIVDNLSQAIAPIDVRTGGFLIERDNVKPFLRSIHKLTKEELEELEFLTDSDYVDYCNKHHIDYRNLIPKGLALEAPEGMYNIKEK